MSLFENFYNAFATIFLNKLRAGLSMLGIVIGVSSVIIMIAIGDAAQSSIVSQVQSLGTNLITVTPGSQNQSNVRSAGAGTNSSQVLTMDHVNAIAKLSTVDAVAPNIDGRRQVAYLQNNTNTSVHGVTPSFQDVRNFHAQYGQFISDEDVTNNTHVAVLGYTTANTLFGAQNPIGKDIIIGGTRIFTVVGVMEQKGSGGFGNTDDVVLIPLSTAEQSVFGTQYLADIYVSVKDSSQMAQAKTDIEQTLMRMLKITKTADENFTIQNQADALSTVDTITNLLKGFLSGIAAISLIVGGIGVMNIMLVSVTERIREIGIRKAIGATRMDILLQFLTESIVLSSIGGILGILLSAFVLLLVKTFSTFNVSLS